MGQKGSTCHSPSGDETATSSCASPSKLEGFLRNGFWDEARSFLQTAEGKREVEDGLTSYVGGGGGRRQGSEKIVTSALFVSIFHRAPLDIIETVYGMKPADLCDTDLHCALESSPPGDVRRMWHDNEHGAVIEFLAPKCPDALLKLHGSGGRKYTPLAHAVANHNASPRVVKFLCFMGPPAIHAQCYYDEFPLLPIDLAVGQKQKRHLLLLGSAFYQQHIASDKWEKIPLPNIDSTAFVTAIGNASERKEWELLRDLITDATEAGVTDDRIERERLNMERHTAKLENEARADQWRRRNFGPVMYQVDVIMDLVSPLMPNSRKRTNRRDYNANMIG